jgi:uncharacterized protein YecT (DUF1311 family)
MAFPAISLSAQATITDAEYKALLGNQGFKNADQSLGAAYKACLAASKNETEKKERIQSQRKWIKLRDEEAFKRFKKGSPAYIQYLIDKTVYQADTLSRIAQGDVMSIKGEEFFDTLNYDEISYDGVIKPEHRRDTEF